MEKYTSLHNIETIFVQNESKHVKFLLFIFVTWVQK